MLNVISSSDRQMSRPANVATGKCRDRQMSRPAEFQSANVAIGKCRDRQMSRPANVAIGKSPTGKSPTGEVSVGRCRTILWNWIIFYTNEKFYESVAWTVEAKKMYRTL